MERISLLFALVTLDDDGVASVVTTGTTRTHICLSSKDINKLALALVTPLGAEATLVSW